MTCSRMNVLAALSVLCANWAAPLAAEELSPDNFLRVHQLIKPQEDESKWLQIPWLTSIWEARQRAAADGKPILIWSGGGAPPIGGC